MSLYVSMFLINVNSAGKSIRFYGYPESSSQLHRRTSKTSPKEVTWSVHINGLDYYSSFAPRNYADIIIGNALIHFYGVNCEDHGIFFQAI